MGSGQPPRTDKDMRIDESKEFTSSLISTENTGVNQT